MLEAEDDEEKESEVDGEVEERDTQRVHENMMNEAQTRILNQSVMCKESNEDDTKETLQTNKQKSTHESAVGVLVRVCSAHSCR